MALIPRRDQESESWSRLGSGVSGIHNKFLSFTLLTCHMVTLVPGLLHKSVTLKLHKRVFLLSTNLFISIVSGQNVEAAAIALKQKASSKVPLTVGDIDGFLPCWF